jgi:uncharacterized protein YrzB (UPF0473 family)
MMTNSTRKKLSLEEKAEFLELTDTDGFQVFISILADILIDLENRVMSHPLLTKEDERKIFIFKSQYDGARKMLSDLDGRIQKIRLEASNSTPEGKGSPRAH